MRGSKRRFGNASSSITAVLSVLSLFCLTSSQIAAAGSVVSTLLGIPTNVALVAAGFVVIFYTTFGGMMTALGMGILLSFLVKQNWYLVIFMVGFMLVTYFNLSMMGVAILAAIVAVVYYKSDTLKAVKGVE